jgi:hypothetical protein
MSIRGERAEPQRALRPTAAAINKGNRRFAVKQAVTRDSPGGSPKMIQAFASAIEWMDPTPPKPASQI